MQAGTICALLRAAYTVEAQVIGVDDFAPLRRTAADISGAPSTFFGCTIGGRLVAVAEIEAPPDGPINIGGFAVHPSFFRRGIGSRLLRHVLQATAPAPVTVSTAATNDPAIALYEAHGFRVRRRWTIQGIQMVTLVRE
jgi:ribosomal protein S18 acetylase RimI-like enzyme